MSKTDLQKRFEELEKQAADEFYLWVGKCIKQWGSIETMLFDVFDNVLQTDRNVAAAVYFQLNTIDQQISLVSHLMYARFLPDGLKSGEHAPQVIKNWEKMELKLRDHLPFRNFIAHSPVSITHAGRIAEDGSRYSEIYFEVWRNRDDAKRPRKKNPKLMKVDVAAMKAEYEAILPYWRELKEIVGELQALREARRGKATARRALLNKPVPHPRVPTEPKRQP